MPYNPAAESFHMKKFCIRLPSIQARRKMAILRFWALWGAKSE